MRIVELFPAAVRRTFTLHELSRPAATVDTGALRIQAALAPISRLVRAVEDPHDPDRGGEPAAGTYPEHAGRHWGRRAR